MNNKYVPFLTSPVLVALPCTILASKDKEQEQRPDNPSGWPVASHLDSKDSPQLSYTCYTCYKTQSRFSCREAGYHKVHASSAADRAATSRAPAVPGCRASASSAHVPFSQHLRIFQLCKVFAELDCLSTLSLQRPLFLGKEKLKGSLETQGR